MFPLLPKGDQTKLLKFFWLQIFSVCHRCRWHRWQTLSCEYLREFSKKFETVLMEYSGAGGKLIHEKKPEAKNLVMYKAAVISTAPYISTHIFLLYFFFKNLSPLSLYTHKHLDDIISQACYRHRRHIPEERHSYKVHTISHKLLQGGRFYQDPTRSHTKFIQFHTISYTQQARTFYYKRWLLLDIRETRLDLGLSED